MALTPEHKRKMQEGRQRAQERRRNVALQRVRAYRAWLKNDTVYMARYSALLAEGQPHGEIVAEIGSVPRMSEHAAAVTDQDYKLAREAGALDA